VLSEGYLVLRALHAWLGCYNDHQLLWLHVADDYMILPLSDGGQVLVAWVDNSTTAVLAWRAADNATEAMTGSSVQMAATSFLGNDFTNARVNNATLDPFQQALQGTSSSSQDLAMVCCVH